MTIYAIIVTYNAMRRNWIERCLKSIEASTVPMTAVIIDNGSTDETRTFVPQHFPNAVWLPQEKNLGFGQANNVGLRYALQHEADYVLLLNQDATIGTDAVEKMLPHCDDQTLMSPLHLNGEGTLLDIAYKYSLTFSKLNLLDDLLIRKAAAPLYLAQQSPIPAACWFMPIALIKTIGGFNPLFFHYSEDENYLRRIQYHGLKVKICPSAVMCHDRGVHGNQKVFNKGLCQRFVLSAATDVNLSLLKRLKEYVKILKNSYMQYLPRHQYCPGEFLMAIVWLLCHINKIRASRNTEKSKGTNWL